jgi:hypothetical protein
MTRSPAPYRIAEPAPAGDGPQVAELSAGQCTRCGAFGTHYLTCPSLRLPAGYRLSGGPGPEARSALPAGHRRTGA